MKDLQYAVCSALAVAGIFISPLCGDTIELENGDVLNGQVVSLDAKQLVLKSELLGELKLDRQKVSAIHLGDNYKPQAPALAVNPAPVPGKPPVDPAVQAILNQVPSSDEVLKQLQGGGVDKEMVGALQMKFPLLNTPEASGYFNDTLGGLMSGKLNIQDVRKDAVTARDELKKLQDELGPDGAALNGYMSILNKFIGETAPPPSAKTRAYEEKTPLNNPVRKKTPATFPPKP